MNHFTLCYIFDVVPDPTRVQVIGTGKPLFLPSGIDMDVNLTCLVEMSYIVDVPVTIEITWTGPVSFIITDTVMNISKNYSNTVTVKSLLIGKAGTYQCTAVVKPGPVNNYVIGNGTNVNSINVALCKCYGPYQVH